MCVCVCVCVCVWAYIYKRYIVLWTHTDLPGTGQVTSHHIPSPPQTKPKQRNENTTQIPPTQKKGWGSQKVWPNPFSKIGKKMATPDTKDNPAKVKQKTPAT